MKRFLLMQAGESKPISKMDVDTKEQAIAIFQITYAKLNATGRGKDYSGNTIFVAEDFGTTFEK